MRVVSFRGNERMLVKALQKVLAIGEVRNRLSILIYHRVLPNPDPLLPDEIDAAAFEVHMQALAKYFCVMSLEKAIDRLLIDDLPPMTVCVTFDDGYADNIDHGLPILQRYAIPSTFFIATGFLDGGRMWNDTIIELVRKTTSDVLDLAQVGLGFYSVETSEQKVAAINDLIAQFKYLPTEQRHENIMAVAELSESPLPKDLMMTPEQIRQLVASGMTVGAHTVHHPILAMLDTNTAREEIMQSKEDLESITGVSVRLFAYPNGVPEKDYTAEHVMLLRKLGFDAAVSTAWGVATRTTDVYQLPRFTPWDRTNYRFTARLLHNRLRTDPQRVTA